MLINYLKTAFRGFLKNPLSSFINTLGLAMAVGCCIVVFAYLNIELRMEEGWIALDPTPIRKEFTWATSPPNPVREFTTRYRIFLPSGSRVRDCPSGDDLLQRTLLQPTDW
ncbi:MAG: hypothetical protein HRT61_14345, partial [Ekhidna sp.]|nr:hypothetical protein [Ekhidna sp.]